MQVPQTPTWQWIVGGILTALAILAGVVKLLYNSKEKTQSSLIEVLQKDIDRREKADERRTEEIRHVMITHEKTAERQATAIAQLGQSIRMAIDERSNETHKIIYELVRELRALRKKGNQ